MFVVHQAQALLTKNLLYQSLDSCLHRLASCTPAVYGFLPRSVETGGADGASEVVTAVQRDAAVTHLRFLNIFCNFRHDTFAHAVQLLDLVLGRVKVMGPMSSVDIHSMNWPVLWVVHTKRCPTCNEMSPAF